ncbi:MAG TPA: sigma-54 dependent transcriptional regulator [bacterium]|nr:sigma-54 dependent transcriptional regulator [bacterium]HOX86614.1 sigma-54 dependent transcriptional regulator [bacterium]HPG46196.1 sigma-54 dependent transcriptional regulator [bacterium]HPM98176.1 sigma-54 dependent transcriptional regulator [bacterium]
MKILLVEDDKMSRIALSDTLKKEGYNAIACENGNEGLEWLEEDHFEVVITDLRLPDINGLEIVKTAREKNKESTVIVITGYGTVETAVTALKLGAYDYLTKPFAPDKLLSMLKNIRQLHEILHENKQLKKRITRYEDREIIGNSTVMQKLVATLRSVAITDHTVMIKGESGTGKELVARFLHQFSERHKGPFIAINCAVLPESLLESELFGHEKGAFTGAFRRHQGYIERAHGGTLFIDDIDDLPVHLQVKLLRVLQEREIQPIGGQQTIPVDFRVVCATKIDLGKMVNQGQFREDLYYRLNILTIDLPPLREHIEDLPLLIDHFIKKYQHSEKDLQINREQMQKMMGYHWPGNVRELENSVQRMLALPQNVDLLQFPSEQPGAAQKKPFESSADKMTASIPPFDEYMNAHEREIIQRAMAKTGNNISAAARLLKLPRTTLKSKLDKFNSQRDPIASSNR